MGKRKLKKWADLEEYDHVIQPLFDEIYGKDHHFKGRWKSGFFRNVRPVILELGCGKGEYTVELARQFPENNYIGVDIKGARMWSGARQARQERLKNVAFLRTRIEFIQSFFGPGEVNEIWLTFPDPQVKRRRSKKRLTSPDFLNRYGEFLTPGGNIHLKTDNETLYTYTLEVIRQNNLTLVKSCRNIHALPVKNPLLEITTHYEKQFMDQDIPIKYLCFQLSNHPVTEDPENE